MADVRRLARVLVRTATAVALVSVLEYLMLPRSDLMRGAAGATRGLFVEGAANYNVVAAYLTFVALVMLPLAVKAGHQWRARWTAWFGLMVTGVVLTSSRSAVLALLATAGLYGWRYLPRRTLQLAALALPVVVVGAYVMRGSALVVALAKLRYLPAALPMLAGTEADYLGIPPWALGTVSRFGQWRLTWDLVAQSPIWGNGLRYTRWSLGADQYFTADNYYLETLADTGAVGLLLLCALLAGLYLRARRAYTFIRPGDYLRLLTVGYVMALVALVLMNLVGGLFASQKVWGTFIFVSGMLCSAWKGVPFVEVGHRSAGCLRSSDWGRRGVTPTSLVGESSASCCDSLALSDI
ncbi:MAG: O-antigen ligase family protein [Anaerolineae bacterium]|nr:O-antigen ligase family protein [Anaerolineae bacterium]